MEAVSPTKVILNIMNLGSVDSNFGPLFTYYDVRYQDVSS